MTERVYLNDLGIINAMGADKEIVRRHLIDGKSPGMGLIKRPLTGKSFYAGAVNDELPGIPEALSVYGCRNNRMALAAARQIEGAIKAAINRYSAERIGVVMGTSTSGVDETEAALAEFQHSGSMPQNFNYTSQEVGGSADFLALYYDLKGPAYAISTACSSSGKVFASARGLIQSGLCDAVLVGGADTLCELTLNGFASLEATSLERCKPFSGNRNGINIGEAAAIFLMTREARGPFLEGVGESADALHMSAPDPSGAGARAAMLAALHDAGLEADDIGYINLHGTATKLNDVMESHAVNAVFSDAVPCSSTKPLTGHTLGAAGATEAGLCWLLLNDSDPYYIAPQLHDGEPDPELSLINLCFENRTNVPVNHVISNSFAFGGNNVSIILGRNKHG
jgi:3-oxoacyl-[acyl-carrier-protein] synthase I